MDREELIDKILLEVKSNIYDYEQWLLDVLEEHLKGWKTCDLRRFVNENEEG